MSFVYLLVLVNLKKKIRLIHDKQNGFCRRNSDNMGAMIILIVYYSKAPIPFIRLYGLQFNGITSLLARVRRRLLCITHVVIVHRLYFGRSRI